MDAQPDPVVHPFVPDRELVARAQREMMARETPGHRMVRQRWEEALGANRVALAALREIYPSHRTYLTNHGNQQLDRALDRITEAFGLLDDLAPEILGEIMHDVLTGRITTHDELSLRGVRNDQT